ncbi:CD276 antigen-like isoform X2 [Centropristis striata]|uniref:CD276 antigen-like isoform X2 n=1 Tax=Centropristis striata TaxID=184440 RepID=UPI0027DF724C|nr:CD276 antigen-like isoform X2 [Centropristis striata]
MKLISVLCLCLLTLCGKTSADENGVVRVAVQEGGDVVLPCSRGNKENVEKTVFDWKKDGLEVFFYEAGKHYNNGREGQSEQFKGRVSHFQDELKHGNASIRVQKTKMADSGNYTCTFPKKQTSHITLFVGAASKPSITTLEDTKHWTMLQCEVHGASPEPSVEWRDGSGNKVPAEEPQVSERGGRFYITLNATVTKTDNYHCVVTQETIHHQTEAQTHVYIGGAAPDIGDSNTGWIVGLVVLSSVLGVVAVGVSIILAVVVVRHKNDDKKRRPLDDCSQSEKLQDPETPREL